MAPSYQVSDHAVDWRQVVGGLSKLVEKLERKQRTKSCNSPACSQWPLGGRDLWGTHAQREGRPNKF